MNQFSISPFFSFRWIQRNPPLDNRYNSLPLADMPSCYQQKWQCGGDGEHGADVNGRAQVLSDFACTFKIYTADFDTLVATIGPDITAISGQTFSAYDFAVDFSTLEPGQYYATISYTDADDVVQNYDTDVWDVQPYHANTKLYEVTNTYNDKGIVFVNADQTTKVISFRVEGMLRSPVPKSEDEDYEDQPYNLTQLSAIPFINITDLIGYDEFVLPFWVIEKINLLYSLNKVQIDGQYFTAISGSEWKPTRPENQVNEDGYWAIDIQPNYAYDFQQFSTDNGPLNDEYRVIIDALPYPGTTESVLISGFFKNRMKLNSLNIINNGGDAFDINIGTTAPVDDVPSNDITTINVEAVADDDTTTDKKGKVYDIGHLFTANRDVYINMPEGVNIDMDVEYTDYVAESIEPAESTSKWVPNTLYFFTENEADSFEREFDIATGLGKVGTDHENCVLAGVAGTLDITDMVVKAWDKTMPLLRETSVGSDELTQTVAEMPVHTHTIRRVAAGAFATTPSQIAANEGNGSAVIAPSVIDNAGEGDPMVTTPFSIYLPAFYYVKPA